LGEILNDIQQRLGAAFDFNDYYFAGGCCYCLWNDKEIKDYDIFCKSQKAIRKLKSFFKANPQLADNISKNAITMGKYQFVTKHIGQPEIEVAKFDFKHNLVYFDSTGVHALTSWDDIESNTLLANTDRARDVLNIVTRIPKFVERGMDISQKEIVDILERGTRPTKYFSERRYIKARASGRSRY
jgi:hypothetical protein